LGPADFSEFYAASYARLLAQVVLVTGDLAEAEDLLQEAFVRAAGRWPRLVSYQAPEAWVRRVALNLAADSARRLRRRAAAVLRLASAPPALEGPADLVDLAAALRRLSVGQRQAIVLHHLVGLSVAEVAWELGVPVGTVKTRLARGRRALARWLSADVEEEEVHGNGR
jgi:RNA polymerase sigma-70 factor (ECF subfamily)